MSPKKSVTQSKIREWICIPVHAVSIEEEADFQTQTYLI
jgi:hypothetical protein